jgi:predicted GIY-YIG superfamily endonuclease
MKHKKKNDANKPKKKKRAPAQGPFLVYAIFHTGQNDRCYIGQTNNFERRIKQHNKQLSGGARYTSMVAKDTPGRWIPIYHVTGFQTLRSVLQFELACKRRKVPVAFVPGRGMVGRGQNTKKAFTRGARGKVRQLEWLLSLSQLTDEPHSHFASNGIAVNVFLTRDEYLQLAGMTWEQFDLVRQIQGVPFTFL